MAASLDDPEFYLPTHFLTDDVVLHSMDRHSSFRKNGVKTTSAGFPAEFPYEFDSSESNSALSSPVESVVGSTETESSSDVEDFLAGLTRRLAQSSLQPTHQTQKLSVPAFSKDKPDWVISGSPQSTLSGIGSWSSNGSPTGPSSQVPSPPTTPFGAQNDTWDLIYAAAGQVARLKMTNGCEGGSTNLSSHDLGLMGPPRTRSPSSLPCVKNPTPGLCSNQSFIQFHHLRQDQVLNKPQCSATRGKQVKLPWSDQQPHQHQQQPHQQQQQQIQNRGRNIVGFESSRCGHGVSMPQSAWPPLQVQQYQNQHSQRHNASMRPVIPNGSNVKRESAGTGVFLPRRYTNLTPEVRKKAGCPTVLVPAKVVQALNLNLEDINTHTQPRFNTGLAPHHEALVGRRNALLTQQRRGSRPEQGPLNYEVRLPQEWTY